MSSQDKLYDMIQAAKEATQATREDWFTIDVNKFPYLTGALPPRPKGPPSEDAVKYGGHYYRWCRKQETLQYFVLNTSTWVYTGLDGAPKGLVNYCKKKAARVCGFNMSNGKRQELRDQARAATKEPDAYKERGEQLGIEQPERRADAPERSDLRSDQIANAFSKQDDTYPMWGAWDK